MIYAPAVTELALLFGTLVVLTHVSRHDENWFGTPAAVTTTIVVGAVGVLFTVYRIIDLDRKGSDLQTWQLVVAPMIYGVGLLVLLSRRRT